MYDLSEMSVYIINRDAYDEEEEVHPGAWFTPPIDLARVSESIGYGSECNNYEIADYVLPFRVDEDTPISVINYMCERIRALDGSPILYEFDAIMNQWFFSIDDLLAAKEDIICYSECDSMYDMARRLVEFGDEFGPMPESLQNYIDYSALGRDLEAKGDYLVTPHGIFVWRA